MPCTPFRLFWFWLHRYNLFQSCTTAGMHRKYFIHSGEKIVGIWKPCSGWWPFSHCFRKDVSVKTWFDFSIWRGAFGYCGLSSPFSETVSITNWCPLIFFFFLFLFFCFFVLDVLPIVNGMNTSICDCRTSILIALGIFSAVFFFFFFFFFFITREATFCDFLVVFRQPDPF